MNQGTRLCRTQMKDFVNNSRTLQISYTQNYLRAIGFHLDLFVPIRTNWDPRRPIGTYLKNWQPFEYIRTIWYQYRQKLDGVGPVDNRPSTK